MELHDAEEAMRIRRILPHDTRMKKNPTNQEHFLYFYRFHGVMRSRVQLVPPRGNFINGVTNPEIVTMLLRLQIHCIDFFVVFL